MTTDIESEVKQALRDVLNPEMQQLKGKIEALDARLAALEKVRDARLAEVNTKLDARCAEVNAKLDVLLNIRNIEIRLAKLESRSA